MVDRKRIDDFNARFGLNADPEAFKRFQRRVVQVSSECFRQLFDIDRVELEREFALLNGSRYVQATNWGAGGHRAHGILDELEDAGSYPELIKRLQHLLWSFERLGYFTAETRYGESARVGFAFVSKLARAIEVSPGVDLRIDVSAGRAEFAPSGVPLLDESVDRATQWLRRFPDVRQEFRQALAILAEHREEQFRHAQDSLRYALEKLLKLLLRNNIRLEEQGKPLKEWLTSQGVHESLRDVAVQIMMLLSKQYQNAAVKHDGYVGVGEVKSWQAFEVEYVVYQYATLIRLLSEAAPSEDFDAGA